MGLPDLVPSDLILTLDANFTIRNYKTEEGSEVCSVGFDESS